MKRLGLTIVAACCIAAATYATNNQPTTNRWENTLNAGRLSKYLQLDAGQHEEVSNICDYFNEQMTQATRARKNRDQLLHRAVYGNLKLMKQTLTDKQYAEYLRLLNVTLNNKGIEVK